MDGNELLDPFAPLRLGVLAFHSLSGRSPTTLLRTHPSGSTSCGAVATHSQIEDTLWPVDSRGSRIVCPAHVP